MQAEKPTDQELIAIAKDAIAKFKTIMAHPKWEKIADTPCLMFRMEIWAAQLGPRNGMEAKIILSQREKVRGRFRGGNLFEHWFMR